VRQVLVETPEELAAIISMEAGSEADSPRIRRTALAVVGRYPHKDWPRLLREYVLRTTRWIPERGEVVESPLDVIRTGAADCDGLTALYLALAWSVGMTARPLLVGEDEASGPVHALPEVLTSEGWRSVEVSHPEPREWASAWRNVREDNVGNDEPCCAGCADTGGNCEGEKVADVGGMWAVGARMRVGRNWKTVRCWQPPYYDTSYDRRTTDDYDDACPCPEVGTPTGQDASDPHRLRRAIARCGPIQINPRPGAAAQMGFKGGGAAIALKPGAKRDAPTGYTPRRHHMAAQDAFGFDPMAEAPKRNGGPPPGSAIDPATGRAVEPEYERSAAGARFCSTPDGSDIWELDVPGEHCDCPNVYVDTYREPHPEELRLLAETGCVIPTKIRDRWTPEREETPRNGGGGGERAPQVCPEGQMLVSEEVDRGGVKLAVTRCVPIPAAEAGSAFPWWILLVAYYVTKKK